VTAVVPRIATIRDRTRPTSAASGAFIAQCHRRPWLPWQLDTAAVVGETLPGGRTVNGVEHLRSAYPITVILVPRQCGKTTFLFDTLLGRVLVTRDYRAAYTAQTGHVTTERFGERIAELPATPLARRIRTRRSAGTERMSAPHGSYLKAFPPKDGALRGSALDCVCIDEAQEIDELLGVGLDQTILPTFTTRPRRQLILIGTAGTDMSKYLARYVALGRGGAAGVALIWYGAEPDDDPADPAVWHRVHPGLAGGLTDDEALQSALQVMGPESFAREYLCVWQESGARLIPARLWQGLRRVKAVPRADVPPVFGVDVAPDRSAAVIVAVWPDAADDVPVMEVIDYAPRTDWVAPRLRDLYARHHPPLIVTDNQGPVLTVADEATRLRVPIRPVTVPEYAAACQSALDAVERSGVGHRNEQPLNVAVAGAVKRGIGDGGWGWGRRTATVDVSPLIAGTLALWAHAHRPARVRPTVASG
jgi:hypothetical protein